MNRPAKAGFQALTDDQWAQLRAHLPKLTDDDRRRVDEALYMFDRSREIENWSGELSPKFQQLADASKQFLDALDGKGPKSKSRSPALWFSIADDYQLSPSDYDRVIASVSRIRIGAKKRAAQLQPIRRRRGGGSGRRDQTFDKAVTRLIGIWAAAGGHVGGRSHDGKGGPLVRFLQDAAGIVLQKRPTADAARKWIRRLKATGEPAY